MVVVMVLGRALAAWAARCMFGWMLAWVVCCSRGALAKLNAACLAPDWRS